MCIGRASRDGRLRQEAIGTAVANSGAAAATPPARRSAGHTAAGVMTRPHLVSQPPKTGTRLHFHPSSSLKPSLPKKLPEKGYRERKPAQGGSLLDADGGSLLDAT